MMCLFALFGMNNKHGERQTGDTIPEIVSKQDN